MKHCFTEESKGGRAGLIRAHAHAMSKFVFLCPLFFCFLTSRLLTYAQLQDDCPSIYNANVAQDSKPWADDPCINDSPPQCNDPKHTKPWADDRAPKVHY